MLCAEAVIKEDEEKARRKELAARYVSTQKALINNHIKTFFQNYEIGDVDYSLLDRFKTYLFNQELVASSVKLHFVSVKKIFGHAQRHGIIKVAPLFPKIKQEDNPRAYFKLHQYVKLRRVARRLAGYVAKVKQSDPLNPKEPPKVLRNIVVSRELEWMIGFMVYTFIRPTDLKQMRHKDIEIRQGDDGDYLWMPLPKSKKHDSPITSMPRATYFYRKLVGEALQRKSKALGKEVSREDILEDYVFYPEHAKRDYAYQQIYRQFDFVLETAQLKRNDRDEVFAPYSLRHTSIMYRLIYGGEINTTKIAKNARTSTEMLERFYVAQLESTDVTRDLHRRKKSRKQQKPTTFIGRDNIPDLNDLIRADAEKIPEHLRNRPLKVD